MLVKEDSMKKFILNADDLAKSEFHNKAVLDGYNKGLLLSTSIMANMPFYDEAINLVVKTCPNLSVGVHLNIIEGKSLITHLNLLVDNNDNFNNGYLKLLLKSQDKNFLLQVEKEFRAQIEKCLKDFTPTHLDSHVHVHSIPEIFKIVAKLAVEYNIKQVRTQAEIPYFTKEDKYNPINFVKVLLLNYFSIQNKVLIKKNNLQTNDYLIGVGYTGMMNSNTLVEGLRKIKKDCVVEALIHPEKYPNDKKDSHSIEFEITQDLMTKDIIETLGFKITNYKENMI